MSSPPALESTDRKSESGLLARAVERPVAVLSCLILVVFFGALAVFRLPIQLTPDISLPTVTVSTSYPGASPIEVESEIVEEQEEVLKSVEGLQFMESEAKLGGGSVTLEFEVGTDIEQALVRVSNQLSQVPSYPEAANQPVVSTARSGGPPLAVILISSLSGGSVSAYRTWVEDDVVPELERVKGVSSTRIVGGQSSEIQVQFEARQLAARGLTIPLVAERVRGTLRNRSAGDITVGKRRLLIRTRSAPREIEALSDLVLQSSATGEPIYLRDVATVELALRKRESFALADDHDAIALLASREAGTNVLEVTEKLKAVVERLDRDEFAREGLTMKVVSDQTPYIYDALGQVQRNLLYGALLATIVLLLFLRSVSASLIVALAIPVCVLGTALGMTLLGRTVNVVSLAGITFAVGMVVDNSIVALENIDTWRSREADPRRAALLAIREVWGALLASTATTVAVFLPIIFWEGEVGELLRDIAYAVAISVTLSLAVAVLVIPSLAALLLRARGTAKRAGGKSHGRLWSIFSYAADFRERISDAVSWTTSRAWRAALIFGSTLVATAVASFILLPKMEYLPTGNRNLVFGIVLPPPGVSVEELRATGFANQEIMKEHTGPQAPRAPQVERSFFVGDPSRLFVGAVAQDPEQVTELRDFMQALHARMPGVINFASQAALFARGIGEGRAVEVVLSGRDLGQIVSVARQLFGTLREAVPGARVQPDPVLDEGAPELELAVKQEQAMALGFTVADVALVADAAVDGAIIGEFAAEGDSKVDVVLTGTGPEGQANADPGVLATIPVATPHGEVVPFESLVRVETSLGPTVIKRVERRRAVLLKLTPPDNVAFEEAIDRVRGLVARLEAEGKIPPTVGISLGGSAGKLAEAQSQFAGILLVALLISFFLLAALFEDFIAPLAVLVVLPMASAGGLMGLALVNRYLKAQPLDLVTALGFLILIGVVVNNAILIVDGAVARLREGVELTVAVTEAVRGRVRPIFMSTLTSLAGLAPLVFSVGAGSELYRGVGTVVLGGLALSTVLSLFAVPALFVLLWSLRSKPRVA